MTAWLRIWACSCVCLFACGDSEDGEHNEHDEAAEFEGCPEDIPEFSFGMTTATEDGTLKAALVDASPAPPARFFNDWTIEFKDADDAPAEDVRLRRARAFMPVHGHYGTPDPRLGQHGDAPAVFDLDRLNLFMRGPWQIILSVSSPNTSKPRSGRRCRRSRSTVLPWSTARRRASSNRCGPTSCSALTAIGAYSPLTDVSLCARAAIPWRAVLRLAE